MATLLKHPKGFLVIKMEYYEAAGLGFGIPGEGCVCARCDEMIPDEIYYVPAVNDTMCPDCLTEWLKTTKRYREDAIYEQQRADFVLEQLGLHGIEPKMLDE